MTALQKVSRLDAGMRILVGGDRMLVVSEELAERFRTGDTLKVLEASGTVLHVPACEHDKAHRAVTAAVNAFQEMAGVNDEQIRRFYQAFAERLADDRGWASLREANRGDVSAAKARGRSTTRLVASDAMREGMIKGLRVWGAQEATRHRVLERVDHGRWSVELRSAAHGVVGFIFEGRPNVLADATGVLLGGNTVVYRIGSDALGTAKALMRLALEPALAEAQLPADAVTLLDSSTHAAGWALFSDQRLGLAVARGSGPAVATLGELARQSGIPVSLHGTGGAWLVAAPDANPADFEEAVFRSLDRKVCNTLNTCCIARDRAEVLVPRFLSGLARAGERLGHNHKLHVVARDRHAVSAELFEQRIRIRRAAGDVVEALAETITEEGLGREWEWEQTPEVTLTLVDSVDHAIALFNRYSPRFVACLISADPQCHERFYRRVDAPFVGDGFTRWVDGQYALGRPELGLSNWEHGRLLARGGVLSGDSVFTIRTRALNTQCAR